MEIMDLKYPYFGYVMTEEGVIYLSVVGVAKSLRGRGLFRKFIDDTKKAYDVIKVPQPSPLLQKILTGYGFVETSEWFGEAGEMITVMVWGAD